MKSYKENLPNITTFIFDVDGVLTDGQVILSNDDYLRALNSRDAYAMQYAIKMDYKIFIVTGGSSKDVESRLLNLGVTAVFLKSANKLNVYNTIKEEYKITDAECLYMGDDIPDYQVMQKVGVATCPQDAAIEIKAISHYQSPFNGGRHAVRDVIEQTLRVQDKWFKAAAFEW